MVKGKRYISILLTAVIVCFLEGCFSLFPSNSVPNNGVLEIPKKAAFRFEHIESEKTGRLEFDPTGIDHGIVFAVNRYDAYKAFLFGGEYQDHDFPYRNLRIKKAEQLILWDPEKDDYKVAADLSDCNYGCTNWLYINDKIYFVAIDLNDESFNNPDYDHGWCAPYEIICIDHGKMRILDSCEGMTGASDIPVIYEYKNQIYYFCSNSIENHRKYHLKKINPMTDDVEIIDSIEYDAESTETDVMAVRRVSSQGTMVCQLFAYIEHSDDRETSVIHEFDAESRKTVNYEIPGYIESAISLENYIIMNTTSFDEESHQIYQQVEIYKKDSKTISGTGLNSYQKFAADNDEAILFDGFTMTKMRPVYRFADIGGQYNLLQDRDWLEDASISEYIEKYGLIDSLLIDENVSYIFLGGSSWDESQHAVIKADCGLYAE